MRRHGATASSSRYKAVWRANSGVRMKSATNFAEFANKNLDHAFHY